MNLADRLTRGRRALIVWVIATVLLFGLFVLVRLNASSGLDSYIGAAQDRAVSHAAVIGGSVELKPGSAEPVFNRRVLATQVQAEIFDDATVARLRVYGPDGVLLFATDQEVRPGDARAPSEDPGVTSAAEGIPYRSIVDTTFTWSTVGAPASPEELLQTFEPLRTVDRFAPVGVVEVDFFMDDLRAAAISESDATLTVIAILALVCLAIAVLTYRRTSHASGDEQDADIADEGDPEAQVASLRTKLKTAEGRREKAERSLEQIRSELEATTAASTAANERVAALESELAAATARATAASAAVSKTPEPDPVMVKELDDLRGKLAATEQGSATELADLRRRVSEAETTVREAQTQREEAEAKARDAQTQREEAQAKARDAQTQREEAEAKARDAEAKVRDAEARAQEAAVAAAATAVAATTPEPDPAMVKEIEDLRRRLSEAESRTQDAAAKVLDAEAAAAAAQAEAARAREEAVSMQVAAVAPTPAPNGQDGAAVPTNEMLQRLEERIAAAEQRAKEAEERMDRIAPLSDEASDLRARLAKTAARKRLGPSSGDDG